LRLFLVLWVERAKYWLLSLPSAIIETYVELKETSEITHFEQGNAESLYGT